MAIQSTLRRPGSDLTQAYRECLTADPEALRGTLSARFAGKEFVLVRGFLTDTLAAAGLMMADQVTALKDLQCRVREVELDSEESPAINAVKITGAVNEAARADGTIFLMTHSKGSVDTLTALVERDIRDKVAGWVSIQGAMRGSPVADAVAGASGSALIDAVRDALLSGVFRRFFDGHADALRALRTRDRSDYLGQHTEQVAAIVENIPIVAFGSAAPQERSLLRRATAWFFLDEDNHPDEDNDGLVSIQDTIIPGAPIVHDFDGPDHGDAVTQVPAQPWTSLDRRRLTYALLSVLPSRAGGE